MKLLVEFPDSELSIIVTNAIEKVINQNNGNKEEKLYTINQIAKRLGMAHVTVSKLTKSGIIKTTKDGRISEESINDYLKGQ